MNVTGDAVCFCLCVTEMGGCARVLATHVTSGGMIIHQDYTLINLKHWSLSATVLIPSKGGSFCLSAYPLPIHRHVKHLTKLHVKSQLGLSMETSGSHSAATHPNHNNPFNFKMLQRGFSCWWGKLIVTMHFHINSVNTGKTALTTGHYWWLL